MPFKLPSSLFCNRSLALLAAACAASVPGAGVQAQDAGLGIEYRAESESSWHAVSASTEALLIHGDGVLRLRTQLPPEAAAAPNTAWVKANAEEADAPATVLSQQVQRVEWSFTAGRGRAAEEGELAWLPDPDGSPAQVTARAAQWSDNGAASGSTTATADSVPWQGERSIVLLPAVAYNRDGDGTLSGTIIGIYPNELDPAAPGPVARNPQDYAPPKWFHRLDEQTRDLALSPHATLGTLNPAVLDGEGTRFVAIDADLITLWESLHAVVARERQGASGLRVLRGFVSPHERQRLERLGVALAPFSRFQYGDALAIVIDTNRDFRMDDLNGDGTISIADAELLAEMTRTALEEAGLAGGIGIAASFEGPNNIGTPYVHVDTRGWNLTWREE
ncbi:MAG: hypothetical protein PWP23_2062 [Candidatus Sumerlaeota bacterium]|nr:hypothetical protein [Candidatus Sumerlaeota bacterium]